MSRWLRNVGQFLEKLDDQAERVADEGLLDISGLREDEEQDIQDILDSRGLRRVDSKEDEEEVTESDQELLDTSEVSGGAFEDSVPAPEEGLVTSDSGVDAPPAQVAELTAGETPPVTAESNELESGSFDIAAKAEKTGATLESENSFDLSSGKQDKAAAEAILDNSDKSLDTASLEQENGKEVSSEYEETGTAGEEDRSVEGNSESTTQSFDEDLIGQVTTSHTKQNEAPSETASQAGIPSEQARETLQPSVPARQSPKVVHKEVARTSPVHQPALPPQPDPQLMQQLRDAKKEARGAQKEARILKKHVVSLNSQLDGAEAELQAQQKELEQAAERMAKDQIKYKKERETMKSQHAAEVDSLKRKYEQEQVEAKRITESQLEGVRKQLRDLDQIRVQEGGDWNKEREHAMLREREMNQKLVGLEDEKSNLLSQISRLQSQQDSLGTRVESLTQTADNAMAREREADERLDETLSLHARQIALRNAREAELEKTVADLGEALVAARGKGRSGSADQTPGDSTYQSSHTNSVQAGLESEIEAIRNQLAHERQRNDALQRELKDITKERTDEASVATSRQLQFDRKVAEMSQEISLLKRELQETKEAGSSRRNFSDIVDDSDQVKDLSEEVVRQRETIANCNSEISALRSRLKVSLSRAEQAEVAAAEAAIVHGTDGLSDVERAPTGAMKWRRGRTKNTGDGIRGSMKEALNLGSFQGERTKRLGKGLDALDTFLAKSWTVLRYHPVARLVFVLYLLLLHTWTCVLLFFHTHGFDAVREDGPGAVLPHGPQALLRSNVHHMPAAVESGMVGS